jgi:hypothetical protein
LFDGAPLQVVATQLARQPLCFETAVPATLAATGKLRSDTDIDGITGDLRA